MCSAADIVRLRFLREVDLDRVEIRRLSRLRFIDPERVIPELNELSWRLAGRLDIPRSVRNLRTQSLKRARELWTACIFAHGMSQILRTKVFVADDDSADYDFVCYWVSCDTGNICPVQLKEVVPAELNENCSIQTIVDDIAKKRRYQRRSVAIKLTREGNFNPTSLDLSKLEVESLWVFGAISPDQTEWAIWGDLLQSRDGVCFKLPN